MPSEERLSLQQVAMAAAVTLIILLGVEEICKIVAWCIDAKFESHTHVRGNSYVSTRVHFYLVLRMYWLLALDQNWWLSCFSRESCGITDAMVGMRGRYFLEHMVTRRCSYIW